VCRVAVCNQFVCRLACAKGHSALGAHLSSGEQQRPHAAEIKLHLSFGRCKHAVSSPHFGDPHCFRPPPSSPPPPSSLAAIPFAARAAPSLRAKWRPRGSIWPRSAKLSTQSYRDQKSHPKRPIRPHQFGGKTGLLRPISLGQSAAHSVGLKSPTTVRVVQAARTGHELADFAPGQLASWPEGSSPQAHLSHECARLAPPTVRLIVLGAF